MVLIILEKLAISMVYKIATNGFDSRWATPTFTNLTDVEVNMKPLNIRPLLSSDIRKY